MAVGIASGYVVHVDATPIREDVNWASMVERHATTALDGAADGAGSHEPARGGWVSLTDPDASLARSHLRGRIEPSYKQHTAVDDQAGVFLDVAQTTGGTNEGDPVEAHFDRLPRLTGRSIAVLTADAGYAYAKSYRGAEQHGATLSCRRSRRCRCGVFATMTGTTSCAVRPARSRAPRHESDTAGSSVPGSPAAAAARCARGGDQRRP